MSKNSKIILVLIDILAIFNLVYIYYVDSKKYNSNDANNEKETILGNTNDDSSVKKTVKFKKFTFEIPQDVSYIVLDKYSFKLISDDYEAIIEILLHDDTNMLTNSDLYYEEMTNMGIKVAKPEKLQLGTVEIVKYNLLDSNNTLYYFKYNDAFDYEVELEDKNDSLGRIMNILLDAKYDDAATEMYDYIRWYYD